MFEEAKFIDALHNAGVVTDQQAAAMREYLSRPQGFMDPKVTITEHPGLAGSGEISELTSTLLTGDEQ